MKYIIIILPILLFSCKENDKVFDLYDNMSVADSIIIKTQVIIDNDTMDIIKTDWWNSTVTLENNIEYNYNYIEDKMYPYSNKLKIDSIIIKSE